MPPTTVVTGAAGRIGRGGQRVAARFGPPRRRDRRATAAWSRCPSIPTCSATRRRRRRWRGAGGAGRRHGRRARRRSLCGVAGAATPPPAVVASGAAAAPAIALEPAPPAVLLRDNVAATSAVVDAAVAGGAARVVFSSSAFAFGYGHAASGPQAFTPRYLPVDEAHGATPLESYGLSKLMGEEVLETAARTARATSFVSLRFTNIVKREAWGELPWAPPSDQRPLPLLLWAYARRRRHRRARCGGGAARRGGRRRARDLHCRGARHALRRADARPLLAERLGLRDLPLRAPMEGNASPLCAAKLTARLGVARARGATRRPPRRRARAPAGRRPRGARSPTRGCRATRWRGSSSVAARRCRPAPSSRTWWSASRSARVSA